MKMFKEITIIDDDKIQVFLFLKFMEKMDKAEIVSSFVNGKEAFDEMKERSENNASYPDIIFLDLNMPVWDGWLFYDEFKKLPNSDAITIYILTSSLSSVDNDKAIERGLNEKYLNKPLNFEQLRELLQNK
ncbi:MAG: response regulator [Balneolaceae bacterium]|nr:MAG: response regulator [Balneolaceae bacterium]